MGTFDPTTKKFDLQVCLSNPVLSNSTPELETALRTFLVDFFQHVSEVLFFATQGTHQLGTVTLCSDSTGSAQSDVKISSSSPTHSAGKRLWIPAGGPFEYASERLPFVAWFVHELGHYLYDLRDEYSGPANGVCGISLGICGQPTPGCQNPSDHDDLVCVSDADRQAKLACLMDKFRTNKAAAWVRSDDGSTRLAFATIEDVLKVLYVLPAVGGTVGSPSALPGYSSGLPSQFCSGSNHSTAPNYQNVCHGSQHCWLTLADPSCHNGYDYGLVAPTGTDIPTLTTAVADPVSVVDALPTETYVVVLDRSSSMEGDKLDGIQDGAAFLIDHVEQTEQVAMISFSSSSRVDSPLTVVPLDMDAAQAAWRSSRIGILTALSAGGTTAPISGLRAAVQEIRAQPRAASQTVLMFTDGLTTFSAESAEQLLPTLLATGVRLFVVGIGSERDPLFLQDLAERTGGRYLGIDSSLAAGLAAAEIQAFLALAAAIARDDTSVAALHSAPMPTPGPDNWPPPDSGAGSFAPQRLESSVWISAGATRCTIGAFATGDLSTLTFSLFDPSRAEVAAGARGVRAVGWRNGHVFWSIRNPSPGMWRLVVKGNIPDDHRLKIFAFETNPGVGLEVFLPRDRVEPGRSFKIRVKLRAPLPVRATSVRVLFGGSRTSIPARPAGDVRRYGDLVAEHVIDVPVPADARGPWTVLIDVVREAGEALYPRDRVCGNDVRPLDGRETRSVRVERIVRRYVGTVIVGTPTPQPGAPDARRPRMRGLLETLRGLIGLRSRVAGMRTGLSGGRAWIHPDQKALVEAWKRKFGRR